MKILTYQDITAKYYEVQYQLQYGSMPPVYEFQDKQGREIVHQIRNPIIGQLYETIIINQVYPQWIDVNNTCQQP